MKPQSITSRHIENAIEYLKGGELVALPTETVYGLAASADNETAVKKIFEAKGRPAINPLICHIAGVEMAQNFAEFDDISLELAERFWPGPLTMVLPSKVSQIAPSVTAELPTIALRSPNHRHFLDIINGVNGPIAAPSANKSGKMSPTRAEHVKRDFDDEIAMILDDGPTRLGLESTVITVENRQVILLRHGAIPAEKIAEVIGYAPIAETKSMSPRSPGQLLKHYAPKTRIVLNSTAGEICLGFGTGGTLDLSPSQNTQEAAQNLFFMLEELDQIAQKRSKDCIHIAPIPNTGIGAAINDRLQRAAQATQNESNS